MESEPNCSIGGFFDRFLSVYADSSQTFVYLCMASSCCSSKGIFSFILSPANATNCLNCFCDRTWWALDKISRQTSLKTKSAQPIFASSINSLQAWRICWLKLIPPCKNNYHEKWIKTFMKTETEFLISENNINSNAISKLFSASTAIKRILTRIQKMIKTWARTLSYAL